MGPPWGINPTTHRTMSERSYHRATSRSQLLYDYIVLYCYSFPFFFFSWKKDEKKGKKERKNKLKKDRKRKRHKKERNEKEKKRKEDENNYFWYCCSPYPNKLIPCCFRALALMTFFSLTWWRFLWKGCHEAFTNLRVIFRLHRTANIKDQDLISA